MACNRLPRRRRLRRLRKAATLLRDGTLGSLAIRAAAAEGISGVGSQAGPGIVALDVSR